VEQDHDDLWLKNQPLSFLFSTFLFTFFFSFLSLFFFSYFRLSLSSLSQQVL
jgi:RsiW-degrading membrane proteinase PrsW (M82 family)